MRRKSGGAGPVSVLLAVIVILAGAAYLMCRAMEKRAYEEKWSEYDECGLG